MTNTTLTILRGYHLSEDIYKGTRTLVYRGTRTADNQPVVIKFLRNEYPSFSELVQFRNQYTITKNLNLSGIVKPLALENYSNGYALVMPDEGYISLGKWRKGKWAIADFLALAVQLADILHELYQNRVIHKDIKPANILIHPKTQQIKLIDFSISSLLPKETQEIQNPNILEGTLAYISPEQTGRMNRGIDYRTDFYSLGITFYELLTGKLPFKSDDPMELVYSHIAKFPDRIRKTSPKTLANIVMKLMAKNAESRYQSALGLKHDLEICLRQWQKTGDITEFTIAQHDRCDRFVIPEKLYGREREVAQLLAAFDRVAEGNTELMLVAGFSGIGKTAVVNEVHKPIVRQRGYFIKGKYDQFQRNIPFSAFFQAFRNLIEQILGENDAHLAVWKTKILEAVGENGRVIIDVIPELESIIGQQPQVPELSGSAAQNRFNLLFQKFVRVFTQKSHPLTLFLDDLQWADSASLELLKLLMNDEGYLLVLGAYRDNEVSPAHPLMLAIDEVVKTGTISNTITLQPLSVENTNQLIADTLNCESAIARPLTEIVARKTKGNPFFTTQFIKALYQEGTIEFDRERGYWQCDLTQVRALGLTDDVVEFMAVQLQKLPDSTQKMLKLGACIGSQFDLATLAIVSEQSQIETSAALWAALIEGLILPQNDVYKFYQDTDSIDRSAQTTVSYKFLHDRVQQAAYSLIPDEQKQITHYQIGQLLLQQISPEAREERIFELLDQLNHGTSLIAQPTEGDELAQLNLTACRKARSATAYQAAREYATVGLQLLGDDGWQRQYEMILSLHDLAAEVAFLVGDFEQMDRWIEAAIDRAKTPLERVQVYQVKIQALVARNEFLKAIEIGQLVFQMLGVNLPDNPTLEDIRPLKQEIDTLIGDRSIESLIHLPLMTDPQQLAIMQNAARLTPVCYMTGSKLYFLIVALQVKLSIQFGNSPVSAYCYAGYAFQLRMLWGDMTTVFQFGQLGYKLASEPGAKNILAATALLIGGYVGHWTTHLQDSLPILLDGYQAGLETGNLEFMGYDAQLYCLNAYWCGQPLTELEPQIYAYYQQLCDLNQFTAANCVLAYWQTAQILLGKSEDEVPFRQDFYEEKVLSEAKASNDFYRLSYFYLYRFTLNYWLEDFDKAERDAAQNRQYLAGGIGNIVEPVFYFYDSLTVLASLPQSIAESDSRWQRVQENQVKLKEWADCGSMNHLHKYYLVEAEKYRVLNRKTEALEFYDLAIQNAQKNGYSQEEALAHELAAKFYLNWNKPRIAQEYMIEAYYGYARWGAKAKVFDLERRYPQLLTSILKQERTLFSVNETVFSARTVTATSSSSSSISNSLDLATLLKVSHTLSSEIELDKLISTLLHTVIQMAGASKCVLMLHETNDLRVQAAAELTALNQIEVQMYRSAIALQESQDVPITLVNRVKRSLQLAVIIDATVHPQLATDVYIQTGQIKSIVCSPILHQGKLLGMMYLENNLVAGAFTRDRVKLLNLLCAQAAISLENARLYQQAQTYAQQLEASQLQIVQNEKMATLGNLVAGVAHEINNPIGFLNGSINNAKEYVSDLLDYIELYQQQHPPNNVVVEKAEEIDLEFVAEDLSKLLSSMIGASDRIKGISTSLRIFSRADTEHKIRANLHDGLTSTLLILKYRLKANDLRPAIEVIQNYEELPDIECFPGQLNQVFMNILANAIDMFDEIARETTFKYLQSHPQKITIQTTLLSEKNAIEIRISDNGKGMSEYLKAKIFDHLFTTKGVGKGTGLGLAIARQIVTETHSGHLMVESELGQGSKFIIRLPIVC